MRNGKPQKAAERRNVQGEKTRLVILKTAARLFAQRGYDNVRIRDISHELDIAPSLVMHHFGNKALLYRKTVRYYLGDGQIFTHGAEPLVKADISDRQACANAVAESIHIFYEIWHGPERVKHLDRLMLQVIFGRGSVDVPLALDWIGPTERAIERFFRQVNPNISEAEAGVRAEVFFSHIFYPAVIKKLLCAEHGWREFPRDFLLNWKKTVARDFCLGLGLPPPTFAYPEECGGLSNSFVHHPETGDITAIPHRRIAPVRAHASPSKAPAPAGGSGNGNGTGGDGLGPATGGGANTANAAAADAVANAGNDAAPHAQTAETAAPRRRSITRRPLILTKPTSPEPSSFLPRLFPKPKADDTSGGSTLPA
ncbi:MAG: TetR/AcrR family transcriptional regulator [Puniceicoccales bacterium]|jgi:AcrR family transcriptional regulator|nr:TetR/AcrR family transcriptional regulator [Puniceicoccales bacterium]